MPDSLLKAEQVAAAPHPRWLLLESLGGRDFRIYLAGSLVSFMGYWIQVVAQGWLVLELTNSPFFLGLVAFGGSIPVIFFSLLGGVLADRVNRQRVLLVTQSCQMVLAASLGLLTSTGLVNVWHVVAISAATGVVQAFDIPSRNAFLPEIVGKERLMNAISLYSAAFNGARIVGPAVAGLLIVLVGTAGCFYIYAASFLGILTSIALVRVSGSLRVRSGTSVWADAGEGLHYLRSHQALFALVAMTAALSLLGLPYLTLMPAYARDVLGQGAGGLGLLLAAGGVGAFGALIGLAAYSRNRGKGRLALLAAVGFSAALSAFGLSRSLALSAALMVGIGGLASTFMVTANTLLQVTSPDRLRGRVMSVYSMVVLGLMPIGSLLLGTAAEAIGVAGALLAAGLLCFASAAFLVARPALRSFE